MKRRERNEEAKEDSWCPLFFNVDIIYLSTAPPERSGAEMQLFRNSGSTASVWLYNSWLLKYLTNLSQKRLLR
jgi:hypothetical protein